MTLLILVGLLTKNRLMVHWLAVVLVPLASILAIDQVSGQDQREPPADSSPIHHRGVRLLAWSPNGRLLATAGEDGIRVWEVAARRRVALFDAHRTVTPWEGTVSGVAAMEFSGDSKRLVSAGWDGVVAVRDIESKTIVDGIQEPWVFGRKDHLFALQRVPFSAMAISHDERVIAVGACGTVQLWDLTTKRHLGALGKSPKTRKISVEDLAQASSDVHQDYLPFWEARLIANRLSPVPLVRPSHVVKWSVALGTAHRFGSILFSPDDTLIAAVDRGDASVWDRESGQLRMQLQDCSAIAFSPNGELLAGASDDAAVRVWEIADSSGLQVSDF